MGDSFRDDDRKERSWVFCLGTMLVLGALVATFTLLRNHMQRQDNVKCIELIPYEEIDIAEYTLRSNFQLIGETWSLENESGEEIARFRGPFLRFGMTYDVELPNNGDWVESGWTIREQVFTWQGSKFNCDLGDGQLNTITFSLWDHLASFIYNGKHFESHQGSFERQFRLTKDLSFCQADESFHQAGMAYLYIRKKNLCLLEHIKICVGSFPEANHTTETEQINRLKDAVEGGAVALTFVDTLRGEAERQESD